MGERAKDGQCKKTHLYRMTDLSLAAQRGIWDCVSATEMDHLRVPGPIPGGCRLVKPCALAGADVRVEMKRSEYEANRVNRLLKTAITGARKPSPGQHGVIVAKWKSAPSQGG